MKEKCFLLTMEFRFVIFMFMRASFEVLRKRFRTCCDPDLFYRTREYSKGINPFEETRMLRSCLTGRISGRNFQFRKITGK